jgi:integration host factor subunit beta
MNKNQLVAQLAQFLNKPRKECGEFLEATLLLLEKTLAQREDISIRGFGTFKLKHRPSRDAQNPASGEWLVTQEKYIPVFTPAKSLVANCSSGLEEGSSSDDEDE